VLAKRQPWLVVWSVEAGRCSDVLMCLCMRCEVGQNAKVVVVQATVAFVDVSRFALLGDFAFISIKLTVRNSNLYLVLGLVCCLCVTLMDYEYLLVAIL
jgi:hypothetical protein